MRRLDTPGLFGKVAIVMFVLAQCADGILTYKGVSTWGVDVEANLLVVWVMSLAGIGPGFAIVKIAAIIFGVIIYGHGFCNVLATLTVVYLVFAILPWIYLFLTLKN